jgi:hypothetical protein
MKILVLNSSGNVGKSFLTRELLFSKCNKSQGKIVEIETYNNSSKKFFADNDTIVSIGGNEIDTLFEMLLEEDNLVVDIGASNIIEFFNELLKNDPEMILEEIDYFVIPTTPDDKIKADTLKVASALKNLGVANKVIVIYNKADFESQFKDLIDKLNEIGIKTDFNKFNIPAFKAVSEIEGMGITITQLANSEKDYKALAKEEFKKGNKDIAKKYSKLALLKGSAKAITETLNNICQNIKN